jgi:hypothetical protein
MLQHLKILHLLLYFLVPVIMVAGCTSTTVMTTPTPTPSTMAPTSTLIPLQWTFDTDPVGELPQGATVFSGNWLVRAESDAPSTPNTLCQIETAIFPAMTLSDTVFTDVIVSTRFKPISGSIDRAAGIIFRVQDENNYYILRANALENNVDIRKYVDGIRITLKITSIEVLTGQWQELRVEVVGSQIQGFLNNELVVETSDDTFQSGKIGLWTKADSVTCFDDVEARTPL